MAVSYNAQKLCKKLDGFFCAEPKEAAEDIKKEEDLKA